jgi:prepilin signal peptidase PulO-like enzyme (type II secretory pathway)
VLGIGWMLGITAGISAIILAFWIGAAVSVIWMFIVLKKFKAKLEIPFGPYLILGMYLVLLFGIRVIDLRIFYEAFLY